MAHRICALLAGALEGLDHATSIPMQLLVARAGGRSLDMERTGDHRLSGDHSSEHHDLDGAEEIRHDDIASGLPFVPIALVSRTNILSVATDVL